mmetsp:Transcript_83506/g.153386  ORF Transcript_83506/g.153386 Transcript_83506/m.153386 type:complete len:119 (-) Transcript_83506:49-405(-)
MDPILVANLKAIIAGESDRGKTASRDFTYERESLRQQRQKRGELLFLERMQVDATSKKAFTEACALRDNPVHRSALDRAVQRMRPLPEAAGPRVVTHDSKLLYEGQNRKMDWAPLEYY